MRKWGEGYPNFHFSSLSLGASSFTFLYPFSHFPYLFTFQITINLAYHHSLLHCSIKWVTKREGEGQEGMKREIHFCVFIHYVSLLSFPFLDLFLSQPTQFILSFHFFIIIVITLHLSVQHLSCVTSHFSFIYEFFNIFKSHNWISTLPRSNILKYITWSQVGQK